MKNWKIKGKSKKKSKYKNIIVFIFGEKVILFEIKTKQREIPLLKSEIMELDQEKQQLKSEIIKDFNDVNKPLVKIQQRLIEYLKKQKEKQQKK